MSDYVHGKMDVSVQKKTFDGFIKVGVRLTAAVIVSLVLLAIFGH